MRIFSILVRVRRLFISCSSPSISSCLYFYCVCGRRWSWDFLKYVIKDTLNYGSAPDPFWGSRGDGNVASSLCASLLPLQRDRPGRSCSSLCLSHRCVQFPNYTTRSVCILTGIVTGAAGHNRGGVAETPLFARTQGGNFDGAPHRCFWLCSYGRAARVFEHEQVEYSPKGYWAPELLTKVVVLNGEQHFQAMRPRVMVLNEEQHFQAMRPSISRRTASMHGAGVRTSGIVGCRDRGVGSPAGTPHTATIPKTGGRLTQAPASTNPTTGQAVVIF